MYAESEADKLFAARFIPLREVDIPQTTPECGSTPPEIFPTTPVARRSSRGPKIVSPSEETDGRVSRRKIAVKREIGDGDDHKPSEKRRRVAFA